MTSDQAPTPIVLAAGPGERLWPLTKTRPKPMVPVAGKPILAWCLRALREAGLEEATIVVGHKASTIQSHFQDGSEIGLDLTYVEQSPQAGTAHAVATALRSEGIPEQALVLGGDNVVEPHLIEDLVDTGPDAIGVTKSEEASRYGVVTLAGDRIQTLREKPLMEEEEGLISTGCYLFQRSTLDKISRLVEEGIPSLPSIIERLIEDEHEINASVTSGEWHDAVYPWDLVPMTDHLLRLTGAEISDAAELHRTALTEGAVQIQGGSRLGPQVNVDGASSLHPNVRLTAGSQVARSLLLDGVRVGRNATIEDTVLAEGVTIGAGATLGSDTAEPRTDEGLHQVDRMGAVVGEGTSVGAGAVLTPGTIVGANATIEPGAVVSGRVPDGGWVKG